MDYCPGGDVGCLITKKRILREKHAKIIAAEILIALEYLHSKKIIYRDLKPDNVVIDQDGHAMLCDYGLAKFNMSYTKNTDSFCGSVAYLAPEMLQRQGHNLCIDWYLFGILIYEMLAGIPPHFHPNREKLFDNIKHAKLKFSRRMSETVIDLLKKLLTRDVSNRLGSLGANEIKMHEWFNEIDWKEAGAR